MYAWFFWNQLYFATFFSAGMTILFALTAKRIFSFKASNIIPVFFLLIMELYNVRDANVNALILALMRTMIISTVLLLNDQNKIDLFQFITKAFAVIIGISVIGWILFMIGIPLPHFYTNYADGYYFFENYYIFLLNDVDAHLAIPRFSGYFLEPGQLGMVTTFLLCANRFNLKDKYVLMIFIANLFTFSLNAYILLLVSVSVYLILISKNRIRNLSIWSIVVLLLYLFFANYKQGDNVVNNLILIRLKFENGIILDRFSNDFNSYFQNFMNSGNLKYWGIGAIKYNEMAMDFGSAGYKVLILINGFVGTLLVFLFYFFVVWEKQSKMAMILLLVYVLSFIQNPFPLMECVLLIFITAMPMIKSIENKEKI